MSRLFKNTEYKITQHAWQTNVVTGTYHKGVDIVPLGLSEDVILAHSDGVVAVVVNNHNTTDTSGSSYGNYIKIKHPNGYYTLYAHIKPNTIRVNVGDTVRMGDEIAVTGMTGRATGVHLHFEVFDATNTKINPETYISSDLPNLPNGTTDAGNGTTDAGNGTTDAGNGTTDFNVGDTVIVLSGYLTADSYGSGSRSATYDGNPSDDSNYKVITQIINDGRPRPVHLRRTNKQGGTPMGWCSLDQIRKA